jgi:hypothetical protein
VESTAPNDPANERGREGDVYTDEGKDQRKQMAVTIRLHFYNKHKKHQFRLWGSDRWWVEAHNLVIKKLFQLFSADIVLVYCKG